MNTFPNIKVQYQTTTTPILSDYYYAIPYGPKYYVWFTYRDNDYVCLFLEVSHRKIISTKKEVVCFDEQLYGTILYGTMVSNKFFVTENIYYYKHENISYKNNLDKLTLLAKVFNQIKQLSYSTAHKILCMPVFSDTYSEFIGKNIPYKVYGIGLSKFNNKNSFIMKYNKTNYGNFMVTADIHSDIYNLFGLAENKLAYFDSALVPSYKTSVYLNTIFRNIKENSNLDAIQESDDEFEIIEEDKYVDTKKQVVMKCIYNTRFKKWVPVEVVNDQISLLPNKIKSM
jgi:hypothetical protein